MCVHGGCHVFDNTTQYIQCAEEFSEELFGVPESEVPDMIVDPADGLLSVVNKHFQDTKIFTITVRGKKVIAGGHELAAGFARDGDIMRTDITTLIIRVEPRESISVGELFPLPICEADLASDIQVVRAIDETLNAVEVGFPLEGGPYLCSQGAGGKLTHCLDRSTYFAVDFECPVGTRVLAMDDGEVCEVRESENCSGIDCTFLFRWNQVSVRHSNGTVSEYVHIAPHSARVKVGDAVQKGDVLCFSGDIGFSPIPHLHVQLTRCDGVSLPLKFVTADAVFSVSQGAMYTSSGPV